MTAIGMFENVTLYHQVTLTGCELPSTSAFALQSKAVPLSRRALQAYAADLLDQFRVSISDKAAAVSVVGKIDSRAAALSH